MSDYQTKLVALRKDYKKAKNKQVVRDLKHFLDLLKDYAQKKHDEDLKP